MISTETLRSFPYFAGISDNTLKNIARIAEEREFTAGETLCREGDPARALAILEQGQVDVLYAMPRTEAHIVDTLVPGDLLGWAALMEPHRAGATTVAREPGRYVAIDAAALQDLCEKDHTLGFRLMTWVATDSRNRLAGVSVQLAALDG